MKSEKVRCNAPGTTTMPVCSSSSLQYIVSGWRYGESGESGEREREEEKEKEKKEEKES